jgi:hypothetical protein
VPTTDDIRAHFDLNRYVVLRSVLPRDLTASLYGHVRERAAAGTLSTTDSQVPNTPSAYRDPVMEKVLIDLRPTLEQATGLALFPTYSYYRLYKRGDVLERHRDRYACEISLSVNLGQQPEESWPLWIAGPHGTTGAELAPGDAVLYRGIECEHWREAFAGEHMAQVFFHYVDQAGPYQEWKFDEPKRRRPAAPVKDAGPSPTG